MPNKLAQVHAVVVLVVSIQLLASQVGAQSRPRKKPMRKVYRIKTIVQTGRLPLPTLFLELGAGPWVTAPVPGVSPDALGLHRRVRRLVAARGAAMEHTRARWQELLRPEPPGFWTGLDRALGAARVRGFKRALARFRVTAAAARAREVKAVTARYNAVAGPAERRAEAALFELLAGPRALERALAGKRWGLALALARALYIKERRQQRTGTANSYPLTRAALLRLLARVRPDHLRGVQARHMLGVLLAEAGEVAEAVKVLDSLACASGGRAPRKPKAPGPSTRVFEADLFQGCRPLASRPRLLEDAWVRLGQLHLSRGRLSMAASAFNRALAQGQNGPLAETALFLRGMTLFRARRYAPASRDLDRLVSLGSRRPRRPRVASLLRVAALKQLARVFVRETWDGKNKRDGEGIVTRLNRYALFEVLLRRWPLEPGNPATLKRIVLSLEREHRFKDAIKTRGRYRTLFGPGTSWAAYNRMNGAALGKARRLIHGEAAVAAIFNHRVAVSLERRAELSTGSAMARKRRLQLATSARAQALAAYERYLKLHADSPWAGGMKAAMKSCRSGGPPPGPALPRRLFSLQRHKLYRAVSLRARRALRSGAVALRRCELAGAGEPAHLRLKLHVNTKGRVAASRVLTSQGWAPGVLACVKAWSAGLRFSPPEDGAPALEVIVIHPGFSAASD